MQKGWFQILNSIGISVIYFGRGGSLNTFEDFGSVKLKGVNGICSDCPTLLQNWLGKNQLDRVVVNNGNIKCD